MMPRKETLIIAGAGKTAMEVRSEIEAAIQNFDGLGVIIVEAFEGLAESFVEFGVEVHLAAEEVYKLTCEFDKLDEIMLEEALECKEGWRDPHQTKPIRSKLLKPMHLRGVRLDGRGWAN